MCTLIEHGKCLSSHQLMPKDKENVIIEGPLKMHFSNATKLSSYLQINQPWCDFCARRAANITCFTLTTKAKRLYFVMSYHSHWLNRYRLYMRNSHSKQFELYKLETNPRIVLQLLLKNDFIWLFHASVKNQNNQRHEKHKNKLH